MSPKMKHIDDEQPASVDEHFQLLLKDESYIDSETKEVTIDDLPEWYDAKLFKRGQEYHDRNILSMGAASLMGLIAILSVPETLQVLIFTKQSGTVCTAFRRYAQTLLHTHNLYAASPNDPDSKWYKSLNVIRYKHSSSSRRCLKAGVSGIYQRDMAITQFGFLGYALIASDKISMTDDRDGREGLNHIWRVIGYMLGISNRINICRKNEAETTQLCQKIANEILRKYLKDVPPNFLEMTEIMLKGCWYIDTFTNVDASMWSTYEATGLEYPKPIGWYSWINLKYRNFILLVLQLPIIGNIARTYYYYVVCFSYWTLEYFPVMAWLTFGKEQTRYELYPKIR